MSPTPASWKEHLADGVPAELGREIDDFEGKTVLHCHNLHHEDAGMMQIIEYIALTS